MHLVRYAEGPDYQAVGAIFSNVVLDTTQHVSAYNHPALVPQIAITAGTTQTGAMIGAGSATPTVTLSGGSGFATIGSTLATSTAGASASFSTSAAAVSITLAGILSSGMGLVGGTGMVSNAIRNGTLAQILIDGTVSTTVDLYQAVPTVLLYLAPGSHTIEILNTGQTDPAVPVLGSVVAGTGTSVKNGLAPTKSSTQRTLAAATWQVTATGAGTFTLATQAPGAGSFTTVATGLTTWTLYDSASEVPGIAFSVAGPLTSGDSATFTTDAAMLAIVGFWISSGSGGNYGTYTSPVIDTGAFDTQPALLEFDASDLVQGQVNGIGGYVAPIVTVQCGQTPTVDPTWSTITPFLVDQVRPDGSRIGTYDSGLLTAPRARYMRWSFQFPTGLPIGLQQIPWIRDVRLYSWVPERDVQFADRIALGLDWTPQTILTAELSVLAVSLRASRQDILDFIASYSIAGAVNQYLLNIGADLGVRTYDGEAPSAYRVRLQAALSARQDGGSGVFLATQLGLLLAATHPTVTTALRSGLQTVTASAADLVNGPVIFAQTSPWHATCTVPPAVAGTPGSVVAWPGLPGVPSGQGSLGRQIVLNLVQTLAPLGLILAVVFEPDGASS